MVSIRPLYSNLFVSDFPSPGELIATVLNGGVYLIPYDSDKNFGPCNANGKSSHWFVLVSLQAKRFKLELCRQVSSCWIKTASLSSSLKEMKLISQLKIQTCTSSDIREKAGRWIFSSILQSVFKEYGAMVLRGNEVQQQSTKRMVSHLARRRNLARWWNNCRIKGQGASNRVQQTIASSATLETLEMAGFRLFAFGWPLLFVYILLRCCLYACFVTSFHHDKLVQHISFD